MESSSTLYLDELLNKFAFIQEIYLTDFEGALMAKVIRGSDKAQENEKSNKVKISLSYNFNSAIDQIIKTEKWKTKSLITIFDTHTIFQSRLNKTTFVHFLCDNKNFNYELLKEISVEIQEQLQKVEKEIESLAKEL